MAATKFIIEYLGSNISFTGAVVVAQLVKRLLPSTENAVIAKFYLPPTVWKRQKIKKRGRNVPFIKKLASLVHPNLWAKIFRLKFLWKWFLNVLKMCKRGKKQLSLSSPQDVEASFFIKYWQISASFLFYLRPFLIPAAITDSILAIYSEKSIDSVIGIRARSAR